MSSRLINLIVVHCAATPNGRRTTVEDVNSWHYQRGFRRSPAFRARQNHSLDAIGYHFLVYINGAIATGRHLDEIGAHAAGFNQKSVGVCMAGTDSFTLAQWDALRGNVQLLMDRYPQARVVGHRDLPKVAKSCPGFNVADWLRGDMAPLAGHVLEASRP
ncbi:N-acetylmuramoyl-L-alanine amidase [Nitrosovibrio sp. Nv4]|uniref:N-acetylmuramoyl-L-alanine amidase n=1 Tax=Nitrosovibrio sp. Nv4 TaxID=1945880 RepID=UPI000BC70FE2|nr:N-acetylmuramoyl-L-alanine amidase [Nitrosovibrio sp. Nv4]SOD42312.1 N-acetylmuramoyl-L-alanine amidase [Nitrosovibrio sp. Nv4]